MKRTWSVGRGRTARATRGCSCRSRTGARPPASGVHVVGRPGARRTRAASSVAQLRGRPSRGRAGCTAARSSRWSARSCPSPSSVSVSVSANGRTRSCESSYTSAVLGPGQREVVGVRRAPARSVRRPARGFPHRRPGRQRRAVEKRRTPDASSGCRSCSRSTTRQYAVHSACSARPARAVSVESGCDADRDRRPRRPSTESRGNGRAPTRAAGAARHASTGRVGSGQGGAVRLASVSVSSVCVMARSLSSRRSWHQLPATAPTPHDRRGQPLDQAVAVRACELERALTRAPALARARLGPRAPPPSRDAIGPTTSSGRCRRGSGRRTRNARRPRRRARASRPPPRATSRTWPYPRAPLQTNWSCHGAISSWTSAAASSCAQTRSGIRVERERHEP